MPSQISKHDSNLFYNYIKTELHNSHNNIVGNYYHYPHFTIQSLSSEKITNIPKMDNTSDGTQILTW